MGYKVNGGAEMTDTSLVRAHGDCYRLGVSPSLSMVRESSVTLVSAAMRIAFESQEQPCASRASSTLLLCHSRIIDIL